MGLFNSGVGKRSRRYSQMMMANNGLARDEVLDTLGAGAKSASTSVKNAFTSGRQTMRDAYSGSRDLLNQGQTTATNYLTAGMNGALERSDQGYDQARQDLVGGRDASVAALTGPGGALSAVQGGYADALTALRSLYGQSGEQLQGAVDAWNPLLQQGQAGYTMYQNALGLNGQEGRDAALGAFQAGPGYEWQTQQAQAGAQRAANRTGSGATSGNAMDAVTRLSANLANQEYGNWTNQLQGFQGATERATTGRVGALNNLAQLYAQQGTQESELATNRGSQEAAIHGQVSNIHQTSGQNLAANSAAQGTAGAGIVQQGNTALATNATNYAQLLGNLRYQYGTDQTNLRTGYGTTMAGLQTGLAGAKASTIQNYWNAQNQALGVALQGSNQQGAETASWGQGLLSLGSNIMGLGVSGGGTLGGNFLSSLFK